MGLSKENIEDLLSTSNHPTEISKSLSNYFEGLEDSVSVAIGFNDDGVRDENLKQIDDVVQLLRAKGIDAVSYVDEDATKPDKFIVDKFGVSFPFMTPEDSLKATILIEDLVLDKGYQLIGHANPQTPKSLLYSSSGKNIGSETELDQHKSKAINLEKSHPDLERFNETVQRNGGNYQKFIDKKVLEAYNQSEEVNLIQMSEENVYLNEGKSLFRGGTLGNNPYAAISEFNARKVAHSSPSPYICSGFDGKNASQSTKGGGEYKSTEDHLNYGFIYQFESMGERQLYYGNVGLETGTDAKTIQEYKEKYGLQTLSKINDTVDIWNGKSGEFYEAPLQPHHNKLEAIYIHVGQGSEENKLFAIPLDENGQISDPEWRDFLYLHEPSDDKIKGFQAERQDTQKREQEANPTHAYQFELKNNLEQKNYKDLSNIDTMSFVKAHVHRGNISRAEDGTILCNEGVSLEHLDAVKLPDFSNLKIKGDFNITGASEISMTRLPEINGNLLANQVKLTDIDKISTDKFVKIFNGKTDSEGYISFSDREQPPFDGHPFDINNHKFTRLDFNMQFEKIGDLPETVFGCPLAQIKDQSDIEQMAAPEFLYKILGNQGASVPLPPNQSFKKFKLPIQEKNLVIDLHQTNIAVFPKDLQKYDIESIKLNPKTEIHSLKTIPVTSKGIYDLNFNGDLKEESFESFLNKVKGTEWVEANTCKAEDGHLIIKKDLNFLSQIGDAKQAPINIESFPYDFTEVEFQGRILPTEINNQFVNYKDVAGQKDLTSASVSLYGSKKTDADLSEFKAINLTISVEKNNSDNLKLPKNLETFNIEHSDLSNFKFPELPSSCKNCSLCDVKIGHDLAFPKEVQSLDLDGVQFPENTVLDLSACKNLVINNCDLSKVNLILPKEADSISIKRGVKFPDNFKLDFSGCKKGSADTESMKSCSEVVLPPIWIEKENIDLPASVKEFPISFLQNNRNIHVTIPDSTHILEDEKLPIKTLKSRGLSNKQIRGIKVKHIKAGFSKVKDFATGLIKKLPNFAKQTKEVPEPVVSQSQPPEKKLSVEAKKILQLRQGHAVQSENQNNDIIQEISQEIPLAKEQTNSPEQNAKLILNKTGRITPAKPATKVAPTELTAEKITELAKGNYLGS